jgi:hypothetical protein
LISPLQGRDSRTSVVLCEERRRFPEPKRPGLRPLPGEGGTGWVDGQRDRRLVLRSFHPSPRDDLPASKTDGNARRSFTDGHSLRSCRGLALRPPGRS